MIICGSIKGKEQVNQLKQISKVFIVGERFRLIGTKARIQSMTED
jgi:hypothetical protein